jgi:sec-independent protein translocase protein TatC
MARAIKRPTLPKLPAKLPRLPDPNEPDVFEEMTLLEHMEELRDRIVKSAIAVAIAFVAGIFFARPLMEEIREKANAETGFDVVSPTDPIALFFKIALYIAIGITMPILVWQLIGFLAPGLTRKEKRVLFSSLPFVTLLFLTGASYAFFFAAPRAFDFLSSFLPSLFDWSPEGGQIINFYLTLMIGLGIAFQMPVVMFLLAKLNLVSPKRMRTYRKYAVMAILVVSAVITPSTDPINMSFVAIPLLALYEVGILIAYVFARPKKGAAAAA